MELGPLQYKTRATSSIVLGPPLPSTAAPDRSPLPPQVQLQMGPDQAHKSYGPHTVTLHRALIQLQYTGPSYSYTTQGPRAVTVHRALIQLLYTGPLGSYTTQGPYSVTLHRALMQLHYIWPSTCVSSRHSRKCVTLLKLRIELKTNFSRLQHIFWPI